MPKTITAAKIKKDHNNKVMKIKTKRSHNKMERVLSLYLIKGDYLNDDDDDDDDVMTSIIYSNLS